MYLFTCNPTIHSSPDGGQKRYSEFNKTPKFHDPPLFDEITVKNRVAPWHAKVRANKAACGEVAIW